MLLTEKHLDYCSTPKQAEIVRAILEHGSNNKAAKALGMDRRSVDRAAQTIELQAARMGYSPEHDMVRPCPDGFAVKGVSTYYNDEGKPTGQWVKTDRDAQRQREIMIEAIKGACDDIPKAKPVKMPKPCGSKLLNTYIITDYHLGMLSWAEETGADWDTDIAEEMLVKWFSYAIKTAPKADRAVFAQLGDFLHYDSMESVTPSSGHLLDSDTRRARLVRAAIRVLRRCVNMLLENHQSVHIIMAEGNHDMDSSIWLREIFATLHEGDKRVTVDVSPDPYYCVEHGSTSLFFHHGHKRKPEQIDKVFTAKFRDVFGRTSKSYAHMGHYHHTKALESSLMTVEQHRTLAAPDAYASRGGWLSGRDAKVISYHAEHGEVFRTTINPAMLEAK